MRGIASEFIDWNIIKADQVALWSWMHLAIFVWLANTLLIAINFVKCIGMFLKIAETEKKNG